MVFDGLFSDQPELKRKIDAAQHSLSLCDVRRPDAPLIYVNKGFENLTGYRPDEVVGRNCRMLQGPGTDPKAIEAIREAIASGSSLLLDVLNYRKDGQPFLNRLSLRPVRRGDGELTHYVGIQSDVSAIKALEERMFGFALELGGLSRSAGPSGD